MKKKIISGDQVVRGDSPKFFRRHLDVLHNLVLEIRASRVPPCFVIVSGEEHVLTLKHLVFNMLAGEKSVFCFDIHSSKGNPWDRRKPAISDFNLPECCQVFIIFGYSEMDGEGLQDFYQRCIERKVVLILMDKDLEALNQTDFTLPKNAPVFSFDEKRNLVIFNNNNEQSVSSGSLFQRDGGVMP